MNKGGLAGNRGANQAISDSNRSDVSGLMVTLANFVSKLATILPQGANVNSIAGNALASASENLVKLADASSVASGALRELSKLNLDDALGVAPQNGQTYLNNILGPIKQISDPYFTKIAADLQDQRNRGLDTSTVQFQSGLAMLRNIADRTIVGPGESKSGMVNAAKLLTELTAKIKPDQKPIIIELKYDQNGIIKAFVNSADAKVAMGNTIAAYAALEAHSTVASGG